MSLSIRGLTKRFGSQVAVSDFSLDIGSEEFVTLVGPSGCGKTTTLRMLAGFISPDSGEIVLDGRRISSSNEIMPPEKRDMAMVFQSFANWPHMTIFDNVTYGLKLRGVAPEERRQKYEEMMELVALEGMADRYPSELSGGQQQRIALARALIVHPRVLLLDEPLSNLDARLRERMREDLREIQLKTGLMFVYVTHDQNEALSMSDRIVVMEAGEIHQVDTPEAVYSRPATAYVARFIANCNLLTGRCVEVSGETTRVELADGMQLTCAGGPYNSASVGEDITVGLPPDHIIFIDAPQRDALTFQIENILYLGNQVQVNVRLDREELRFLVTPGTIQLSRGETVYGVVPPEFTYTFSEKPPSLDEIIGETSS